MRRLFRAGGVLAAVAALAGVAVVATEAVSAASAAPPVRIQHVLLISVDGLHQSDLEWYVANHPNSESCLSSTWAPAARRCSIIPSRSSTMA